MVAQWKNDCFSSEGSTVRFSRAARECLVAVKETIGDEIYMLVGNLVQVVGHEGYTSKCGMDCIGVSCHIEID